MLVPFIIVFLQEYIMVDVNIYNIPKEFYDIDNFTWLALEADCFYCFCLFIEKIKVKFCSYTNDRYFL
jgi:hypothetical protein